MTTAGPEQATQPHPSGEVAVLIARRVEPGYETQFEQWAQGILDAAAAFSGHLGYGLFRPAGPAEPWYLVHRFQDAEAYARWHHSVERAAWFARADGHHQEVARRQLTGLEGWFPPNGSARVPARWKMTLTAVLGIFPLSLLTSTLLQPVLAPLPLLARTALVACLLSTLMSYAVMPALTRALRRWLSA
ncbi:antibiotic biosynthesis monooxygenase [Streptomyces sp. FXJ1.4098]|uniref:antibiotic biosynthesis monooxygenase n=1 Tax=Streptomyces sp. NPDC020845 TaxID=3365096 RepID=UPI00299475D7|nr:antibiotic biosynthesis monooxygenase [Streptomyces sp. FXJ1.4098]